MWSGIYVGKQHVLYTRLSLDECLRRLCVGDGTAKTFADPARPHFFETDRLIYWDNQADLNRHRGKKFAQAINGDQDADSSPLSDTVPISIAWQYVQQNPAIFRKLHGTHFVLRSERAKKVIGGGNRIQWYFYGELRQMDGQTVVIGQHRPAWFGQLIWYFMVVLMLLLAALGAAMLLVTVGRGGIEPVGLVLSVLLLMVGLGGLVYFVRSEQQRRAEEEIVAFLKELLEAEERFDKAVYGTW